MICPKCGAALESGTRFCNVCGAPQQPVQPRQPQFNQPVYQQPTYAQQVYQDRQKAMQYDASGQAAPRKPKKNFPVAVVVIAAAVLALCAAALLLGLVFGKKTVYLTTEQVTENQTGTTTYTYEYTEDGKLSFYQLEIVYNNEDYYSYRENITTSVVYTYDKKGKLASVEFEMNGEDYEYEYVYDKEGNLKTLEGDNQEFKIKCDEDGRITSVKSADNDSFSGKYSYHDNGILKKASITRGSMEQELRYNEQGKLLSNELKLSGSLNSRTENKYDDKGNVLENVVETYSWGTLVQTTTTSYTYEDGMAVAYEIEISMDEGSVTFLFETEDEDLERIFEVADIEIVGEDMEEMPEEIRDAMDLFTIEMIYDEHRNLLEMNMNLDEMGFSAANSYSYVAVKVPKNYAMIYQDPIYFQAIDPSAGAPVGPAVDAPAAEETVPAAGY
ncbi:MAG: zinc ribbon domain-containing protein [Oscillospiraceae bacterium]|nr:zinc ribbon domain-containing protein [Oscillospiraceae bacterium]